MNLRPLADKVVIKVVESEERTKSGIVLPDTAKEKPQQGKVMAVGPGRILDNGRRLAPQVKEGDKVVFSRYAGTEVKVDQEEYLVIGEDNILAVIS